MGRMHLFEIEDQNWCPEFVREATTDYLYALYNLFDLYEPAYQKIGEVLNKTQTTAIIDCCSGSGGPIKKLREHLNKKNLESVTITLTDKYPNTRAFQKLAMNFPNQIMGYQNSVEATQLPTSFKGMRTFFSSFHHFKPQHAIKILQNAVDNNAPIGIFESTQRSLMDFIRVLFCPLLMLFITPLAKQMNWRKFLTLYVLPITPFTFMWDYFVSNIRTYSQEELETLISQVNAPHYHWEIGKLWSKKAKSYVPYLIGYPT